MTRRCTDPLAPERLADYWFRELAERELEQVEEHLFGCATCSERLRALVAIGDAVRDLARHGGVPVVVTPSFLDKAARAGLRIREYRATAGAPVACTVTPEDDLLVARLVADFGGVSRVDLVTRLEGLPEARIEDVPVSRDAGELLVSQPMPEMRRLGTAQVRLRLLARGESGERLLGKYVFDHTPPAGDTSGTSRRG